MSKQVQSGRICNRCPCTATTGRLGRPQVPAPFAARGLASPSSGGVRIQYLSVCTVTVFVVVSVCMEYCASILSMNL